MKDHHRTSSTDCDVDIRVDNDGVVNIYTCAPPCPAPCPCPDDDHDQDEDCPPTAPGACVPASLGAKPKQSRRRKLDHLLASTQVPSALGAAFFQLARRNVAGQSPANDLEARAFAVLNGLSPDLRRVLRCAVDSFEGLDSGERDRLFAPGLVGAVTDPLHLGRFVDAFGQEIVGNVGVGVFGDPDCVVTERPGQVRTPPFPGGEFPPAPVVICRINGLRTGQFRPPLAAGDYTPGELQQRCHVVLENGVPKQVNVKIGATDGVVTEITPRVAAVIIGENRAH